MEDSPAYSLSFPVLHTTHGYPCLCTQNHVRSQLENTPNSRLLIWCSDKSGFSIWFEIRSHFSTSADKIVCFSSQKSRNSRSKTKTQLVFYKYATHRANLAQTDSQIPRLYDSPETVKPGLKSKCGSTAPGLGSYAYVSHKGPAAWSVVASTCKYSEMLPAPWWNTILRHYCCILRTSERWKCLPTNFCRLSSKCTVWFRSTRWGSAAPTPTRLCSFSDDIWNSSDASCEALTQWSHNSVPTVPQTVSYCGGRKKTEKMDHHC